MAKSSYQDEYVSSRRNSGKHSSREPYGYPTSSVRESRRDASSSPRDRSRSRSRSRSAEPPTSSRDKTRDKTRDKNRDKTRDKTRDKSRKKRQSGGDGSSSSSGASVVAEPTAVVGNSNTFSPTGMFNNLQSAFNAFQSIPGLPKPSSFEFGPLPETPVTNLLNPKYLTPPASQAVLHDRLATNLPRHSNVYLILLVGTLLATHWLVLAALFAVVKFGFFIQSYNGRDLARELGLRKYTSTQSIMSGFAAAAALVGLWAFSSLFSVVFTLIKVAGLVLVHAACLDVVQSGQHSKVAGSATAAEPVPAQGFLRPHASWGQLPREAASAALQLRSVSEGQLRHASEAPVSSAYPNGNGWYAGEGYTGREEYTDMPRTPRTFDAFTPSPRREELDPNDLAYGQYESGRPQSYASGRSY
ncbi:hypothetical protein EsH8_II_000625 [Colletotrichum jinshuiense]